MRRLVTIITAHDGEIAQFTEFGIHIETKNGSQLKTKFEVDLSDEQDRRIRQCEGFVNSVPIP